MPIRRKNHETIPTNIPHPLCIRGGEIRRGKVEEGEISRKQLRRLWGGEWTGYGFRCSASSACGRRQDDREGGRDGGKREGEFLISKFLRDYLKLALTQSDASTLERESEGERRQPASTQPAKITLIL